MFTGIDDVDWASLGHAYTDSATDVPDLLWGLASDDPARRDIALDGMYGAVHHQGDVYDSTVACIPFLFELVTAPGVADRAAVVGLLCSIAGESEPDPDELGGLFEDEEEDAAWVRPFIDASEMIRGRADVFLGLLDDPTDPGLRAALPGALARLHSDPVRVFGVLRERLPVEEDPEATRALARAIGTLAAEHTDALGDEAGPVLRSVATGADDLEVRLDALVQLARCAPRLLPADTVESVLEVMRLAARDKAAREEDRPAEPERPRTDTMVSYLRELEAARRSGVDAGAADDLLHELHTALGDWTEVRFALLLGQLRSDDWGQRMAAVEMAGLLMTGWRVPDEWPVIELTRTLGWPELRLHKRTLSELGYLAPIAGVVGDVLADCIDEWTGSDLDAGEPWRYRAIGLATAALALQGDARAVPELVAMLESGEDVPEYLPRWVEAIGEGAADLAPVLHRRLAALGPQDRGQDKHRLVASLGALRPAESLPLLVDVLRNAPTGNVRWETLRALGRYGRAADEAAPRIRELVADGTDRIDQRTVAAQALWAVTGDTGAVLPVLRVGLEAAEAYHLSTVIRAVGTLGAAAAPLAPRLRELIAARRLPDEAVRALWQVTGDAEEVLPTLLDYWRTAPRSRPEIAECLAGMGGAAAPALSLVREELASVRRHNNDGTSGNVRYDVARDEALLRDCRQIAAACGA